MCNVCGIMHCSLILVHHSLHTYTHALRSSELSRYKPHPHNYQTYLQHHSSTWLRVPPHPPSPKNETIEVSEELILLTSSSFVCLQGNENVKPKGSFLSLICSLSIKLARHSAMWSNSQGNMTQEDEQGGKMAQQLKAYTLGSERNQLNACKVCIPCEVYFLSLQHGNANQKD